MNDPHVVSLSYRFQVDQSRRALADFDDPRPRCFETDEFFGRLEDGILTLNFKKSYPAEQRARAVAERFLREWEVHHALTHSWRFSFEHIDTWRVDLQPPKPGESQTISACPARVTVTANPVTVLQTYHEYPSPGAFQLTPDAQTLWNRYHGYEEGGESLSTMAYFCLTVVETSTHGDRRAAARRYGISNNVLDTLGRLTGENRGDPLTARKVGTSGDFVPYTDAEERWLEAAVKALVLRVGEWAADSTVAERKITMADLPRLP